MNRARTVLMVIAFVGNPVLRTALPATATTAAQQQHRSIDVKPSQGDPGVEYVIEAGTGITDIAAKHGVSRSSPPPPVYYASFPRLRSQPDGTYCIVVVRRAFASAEAAAAVGDGLWGIVTQFYPLCSREVVPDTTPAAEAAMFWRVVGEDLLPKPSPRIAPGYMLAGKLAYLETGAEPTARFDHHTPLGELRIEATSKVFVDWGDGGGLDGPHDGPGEPWPHGRITHYWSDAGTYDVRVIQRWSATWRLGRAASGQLVGLSTEAVIDDFEVRQLQAVRNN